MEQVLLEQLHRYTYAFDWWVNLIASLPFPVWCALMIICVLYIIEK
jgi:hypothetical protein